MTGVNSGHPVQARQKSHDGGVTRETVLAGRSFWQSPAANKTYQTPSLVFQQMIEPSTPPSTRHHHHHPSLVVVVVAVNDGELLATAPCCLRR